MLRGKGQQGQSKEKRAVVNLLEKLKFMVSRLNTTFFDVKA